MRTAFVPYTNRQVADLQLNFSIADPHEYSDTETVSGDINYSGGRRIDEVAYLFNNEGSADTPLYIDLRIGSQAVNNIAIKVYQGASLNNNHIAGIMLLDSPGYSDSSASNYYAANSRIIIDSQERTVTYNGENIAHHI